MADVIDGTGKFVGRKPKKFTIKSRVEGTLSLKKVNFDFLAVVFWCWLRGKGLNITAQIKLTRLSELETKE